MRISELNHEIWLEKSNSVPKFKIQTPNGEKEELTFKYSIDNDDTKNHQFSHLSKSRALDDLVGSVRKVKLIDETTGCAPVGKPPMLKLVSIYVYHMEIQDSIL